MFQSLEIHIFQSKLKFKFGANYIFKLVGATGTDTGTALKFQLLPWLQSTDKRFNYSYCYEKEDYQGNIEFYKKEGLKREEEFMGLISKLLEGPNEG